MSEPAADPTEPTEPEPTTEPEPATEPEPDVPLEEPAGEPTEPVERSEPEGEPTTPGEPTEPQGPVQEPQGSGALSEKEIERVYQKMDAESVRHAKRVAEIMGDDFGTAEVCPLCSHFAPGFIGLVPAPDAALELLRPALGLPDVSNLERDPQAHACETCDGKGQTLTGSRVPNQETRTCPTCMGRGWVGAVPVAPASNGDAEAQPVLTGPTAPPLPDDDPAIAALVARGYMVVPPVALPQG